MGSHPSDGTGRSGRGDGRRSVVFYDVARGGTLRGCRLQRGTMNNLVYLLIALGLSGVGLLVLWIRSRPSPTSPRSSIEEFNQKMRALSPDADRERTPTRDRRGA